METISIKANFVDIINRTTYAAEFVITDGIIKSITPIQEVCTHYIMPGFVDAHIHIESSMLVPSEFAKIAVTHGTVATVSDPHEIANVCGMAGVQYMIANAKQVNFKCCFGAPSCVPATSFETAGAQLNEYDVAELLHQADIYYLSEVMNYPGVLQRHPQVMAKLNAAKAIGKPIDGHAPGLLGTQAIQYINEGISTDHECFTYHEALHKLQHGMHILIREGSAAKNFEALAPLIGTHPKQLMFCCDDKHPDELLLHHINYHVQQAIRLGNNLYDVLQIACVNPVLHYKLPVGLCKVGHPADFIIVDSVSNFNVISTYINGHKVYDKGVVNIKSVPIAPINNFNCALKTAHELAIPYNGQHQVKVIEAVEGQLITQLGLAQPLVAQQVILPDVANDVLYISVVNRYNNAAPATALIRNFGLKQGAIASTVGHDCHNIIAVGTNATDISQAVNALINCKGGIVALHSEQQVIMPLPIAGLMSDVNAHTTAKQYQAVDAFAKQQLGCTLQAPFMTLSFMALLVIPSIKLSDKGLFDGNKFEFIDL
jgi:adenine deaminase